MFHDSPVDIFCCIEEKEWIEDLEMQKICLISLNQNPEKALFPDKKTIESTYYIREITCHNRLCASIDIV